MSDAQDIAEAKQAYQEYLAHLKQSTVASPDVFNEEESNPDITFKQRFVAKNFGSNPEAMAGYLKEQNPNLDVKVHNGNVYAKSPGDTEYKALDPRSWTDWQDAFDLVSDAVQIPVSTAIASLGGVSAGLPGLAAGWALANGVSESLKQQAGSALGIKNNEDPTNIGISMLAGAAQPYVSAGAKAVAPYVKPYINKAKEGLRSVADFVPRYFADMTKEEAEQYVKNPAAVKRIVSMMDNTPAGSFDLAQEVGGTLGKSRNAINNEIKALDENISELYMGKNVPQNLSLIRRVLGPHSDAVLEYDPITKEPTKRVGDYLNEIESTYRNASSASTPMTPDSSEIDNNLKAYLEQEQWLAQMKRKTEHQISPKAKIKTENNVFTPDESLLDESKIAKYDEDVRNFKEAMPQVEQELYGKMTGKNSSSIYDVPTSADTSRALRRYLDKKFVSYSRPNAANEKFISEPDEYSMAAGDIRARMADAIPEAAPQLERESALLDLLSRMDTKFGKNRVASMKTNSADQMALLGEIIDATGDTDLKNTINQVKAANKITGGIENNKHGKWKRDIVRNVGAMGLTGVNTGANVADYMTNAAVSNINKPVTWQEILQQIKEKTNENQSQSK